MVSWVALAGSAVLGGLTARSWVRVARFRRDPAARPSPAVWARLAGPAAARRLAHGSALDALCLSGLTLLLLGGAWLPRQGDAGPRDRLAFAVALAGLAVFLGGCALQISLVFLGRPLFVLPAHARNGGAAGLPYVPGSGSPAGEGAWEGAGAVAASLPRGDGGTTEILVFRDEADSYARLRRYRVRVDGRRVGSLRPGEGCVTPVAPGAHTVQVGISWCTSPVVSAVVASGDRPRLICRARPGAESDPTAVYRRRHDLLVLHAV